MNRIRFWYDHREIELILRKTNTNNNLILVEIYLGNIGGVRNVSFYYSNKDDIKFMYTQFPDLPIDLIKQIEQHLTHNINYERRKCDLSILLRRLWNRTRKSS